MSKDIGKVVLLTSDWPAARALARAIVERGIVVSGIVIQTKKPEAEAKGTKYRLKRVLGEDVYFRLVSVRWPAEMRRFFFAERRFKRNAERTVAEFLGDTLQ